MKRSTAVFLGFLVISSVVAADPLYKWVDDKGNVHYSDKPQPGAKKIVLPKASTFNPAVSQQPASGSDAPRAPNSSTGRSQPVAAGYTSLAISTPSDQETFWNTDTVTVSVMPSPALRPGDSVTISVDGSSQTVSGTSASFSGLDRGQHTASATIAGVSAPSVTFFIQKTSAKSPPLH